ncbi:MAG: NifU family protein [bacterium]
MSAAAGADPIAGPITDPIAAGDLQASGERIEALLEAMHTSGPMARERAEELVRLVTELYGTGIERLLTIVYDAGRLDEPVLEALADDDLVSSLLLVHGLHPYDVGTRVRRALDGVRPYLGSHGGDVEVVDISAEGVVRLRMLGSCDGCASSSATLTLAVEGAIRAAAPEVITIEVEEPTATPARAGSLISLDSLRVRTAATPSAAGSWLSVPEWAGLAAGEVRCALVGGNAVVGCRVGADLFAFRDRCATCQQSLRDATLVRRMGGAAGDVVLQCPSCRAQYAIRQAGVDVADGAQHLEPLPLLVHGDTVQIAVAAGRPAATV